MPAGSAHPAPRRTKSNKKYDYLVMLLIGLGLGFFLGQAL